MRTPHILLLAIIVSAPAGAGTTDDPICTDRPGKGSAPCTVPKGHWQVETGLADWSLTKSGGERESELDLGASAIKYGLTDHLHVEVDVTPYVRLGNRSDAGSRHWTGFGDTYLAAKQEIETGSKDFEVAIYPFVKLPTAKHPIGNGKVEGGMRVPLQLELGQSFSLSTTPELDLNADDDGHGYHAAMVQVASLNWDASDRLTISAELWGQWDWDPAGTERQASADASAAYQVNDNLQLDAGANFGLNRQTPDVELYAGVAARF